MAPPSIPACAAPGPAAGMGRVTRAGCAVLAHGRPSPPGAGVPGGAGCHAGARCQGREGWKGGTCQGGGAGGTRMQLPPGPAGGGGGQPRVERGPRAPRRRRGARDSRAGSPVAGERLEQEVYGAALSDANGLKPIKRDGFM